MDKERYILVDDNNVVVSILEATTVFEILDSGIQFSNVYRLTDIVPEIGDKFYPINEE